ncbi:unnamed protein product [Rhizoctonia solani]|uniref:Uncharacterized protein n=1 Tax=Rhizoctonia solani TaxID=456999 RepID=A0A8H3GIF0_9AGAM|nr:unnamed protein product [Rhizoctonia solani]
MSAQGAVRDHLRGMIKSSGHVKHFRHQCTALIQICRYFWELVKIEEDEQYQSLQRFVAIANQALEAVANSGDTKEGKELLQGKLDKAISDLDEYCETLSLEQCNPQALMLDARKKDQERNRKIVAVEKLKKIPEIKSGVEFYIHDGSNLSEQIQLNISKKSGSEEILFKLGRKLTPPIKLHENAYFYTGPDFTWNKSVVRIKWGSDPSKYHPKKGISDFKTYFDAVQRGPVHVFVDRNPSIHILLTNNKWSRLFSLSKIIDNGEIVVLKGADGPLYHAQMVSQLALSSAWVFQVDRETNGKARTKAELTKSDCIGILREAHTFILTEDRRWGAKGWLIEICPKSDKPPDSSTEEHKIRHTEKRRIQLTLPDSLPPTGGGSSKLTNATIHVKEMVQRLEGERREAEEKEKERGKGSGKKEKKGFFGRVFGK